VTELHVLRVFTNEEGAWGNRLGVCLDGREVGQSDRQRLARELGFSETVFVEDPARAALRIHTPEVELPFAGHPLVGLAWLLAREGLAADVLRPPAGEVMARATDDGAYVEARPEWVAPFEYRRYDTPVAVRRLSAPAQRTNAYAWAWIDEAAGTIRARSFVPEAGIVEDEATGSAALALCAQLGRPIVVHQGRGSVIRCHAAADGRIEVGGYVTLDEVRRLPS
jgi:predicted PhzF superfamily epimerase YddE/YHI9